MIGVTSPPYINAPDRISKGKIQEGSVADALTRTYDKTNHANSTDNISNLKDEEATT